MKLKFEKIICVLLSILTLICLCSCGRGARSSADIVKELADTYVRGGADSDEKIEKLLTELAKSDAPAAEKWQEIMEFWHEVNSDGYTNYGVLPDGLADTDELCIVAFGFQLDPDGTMKSELIDRLNAVLSCAEKYPNALIACTGGGTASQNGSVTEAGAMADWLIEHGVDEKRIIAEDRSLSTVQNAQLTCAILRENYPQVKKLAVVTSDYHIASGALFFEAECILSAEDAFDRMHVVSNAACRELSENFSLSFQANGLLSLFKASQSFTA